MSQESWLFLFALCGAIGGIATFFDLIWKLISAKGISGPIAISRARVWFTALLVLGSLILSIAGFWTMYTKNQQQMIPRTMQWGAVPDASGHSVGGCEVITDTSLIVSFADKYYVVLVCGITDPSVDQLEDTRIAVSKPFNILGGPQQIVNRFVNPDLIAQIKAAGSASVGVWQRVVLIPKEADPTKIQRLSDVPRFGGKLFP